MWATVAGRPLLALTLEAASQSGAFALVVVVASSARWPDVHRLADSLGMVAVTAVEGGERRQDSVRAGIERCAGHDIICVHDAARPLCPPGLFATVVDRAQAVGAATAALPCSDSVKRVIDGVVVETLDRSSLISVQTPQAFRAELLRAAHVRAAEDGHAADDDAGLVERTGVPVAAVAGDPRNFKVTAPHDLVVLRRLVEVDGR